MKRELKVSLVELVGALEDGSLEAHYYLDLETGQVARVTDEIRQELEDIYQELSAEGGEPRTTVAEAIQRRNPPQWIAEALREADEVEKGYGTRYVEVPRVESRESYRDMEDFITTIEGEQLQRRLWRAIEGRGAFRRFKDVLADYPRERERWFEFKDGRLRERALGWLEEQGIELVEL